MDELHSEPLKKPRKRRFNGDQAQDNQGQLVEYEHGYLRHQIKKERGVVPVKRPKKKIFEPQIVSDCGIELLYVLELGTIPARITADVAVEIWWRPQGKPGPLHPLALSSDTTVPTPSDQALLKFLAPMKEVAPGTRGNRFFVPHDKQRQLCELLSDAGQLRWSARQSESTWRLHKLSFSGKCSWFAKWEHGDQGRRPNIWLASFQAQESRIENQESNRESRIENRESNQESRIENQESRIQGDYPINTWQAFSTAGWVIAGDALHLIQVKNAATTLAQMAGTPIPWMNNRQAQDFSELLALDGGADLSQMGDYERCETVAVEPRGNLFVTTARYKHLGQEQLQCRLSFDYDGAICDENDTSERLAGQQQVFLRSPHAEERLKNQLLQLGFRNVTRLGGDEDPGWKLLPSLLDGAVQTLVLAGWEVTAEGKSYRRPVEKAFGIAASGIDWLELDAAVDFGNGLTLELPELLQAAKKGTKSVRLDDGTYGILPQEWLEKFTALVEIGQSDDAKVRFRQQQATILQALLDDQLKDLDGKYSNILQALRERQRQTPAPVASPTWFTAQLRPYQRQALSWLTDMEHQGLSGILADDMGLGKTVQVLALLARRHEDHPEFPSLVVMPSSLIFNWRSEAERFAPKLKLGLYYGTGRKATPDWFGQHDVVFTTYGTLRQDVTQLGALFFDYIVLDESQAIKNADSATAKATRALRASHRLAMTGTPIENHLAELFSQLCYLNPGLFSQRFTEALGKENTILHDVETASRLRKAVAPFLLRRRKEQVAPELPPKTEQILWCELDPIQRFHYDQLRDFYRKELSQSTSAGTINMLAALLRLRQAACHAGLVNESCRANAAAKLTILNEMLPGLLEAGHKVLIFSQFTTLLQLVARELEKLGIQYCYLDGQTKDRGAVVKEFQEDATKGVFLISLKAGGVGLNLTAADYVFLMDPWWNPAAEAQAIDRTYRIGQTRPVMAYRMIAKDTVEEKVLMMQRKKQRIATTALGKTPDADTALELPPALTPEELRELF